MVSTAIEFYFWYSFLRCDTKYIISHRQYKNCITYLSDKCLLFRTTITSVNEDIFNLVKCLGELMRQGILRWYT